MRKFLWYIFLSLLFVGCSKNNDNTPSSDNSVDGNSLVITVRDGNSHKVCSSAIVQLYDSNYDRINRTNCIKQGYTGTGGDIKFADILPNKTYYIHVLWKGKQNSFKEELSIYCTEGVNTMTCSVYTCSLQFRNNTSSSYKFVVSNQTTGSVFTRFVSKNSTITVDNCEIGIYSVDYEQQDGYLFYPTKGTFDSQLVLDEKIQQFILN